MKDIYVDSPRKEKIMFSYKSSKILMGFVIVVFIFGCQIENNNPQTSTDPKLYLVSSDIGVGSNRIPFFILKGDGSRLTGTNQDLLIKYYKESEDLAAFIQKQMKLNLKSTTKNRGVKQAGFHVLVGATMPNVLVEVGFLSNKSEAQNLSKSFYRRQIAESIYNAIIDFKVKYEKPLLNHNE